MLDKPQSSRNQNITILTVRSLLYGIFQRIFMVIRQPFILSLNPSAAVMGLLEGLGGFRIGRRLVEGIGLEFGRTCWMKESGRGRFRLRG